MPKKIAEEGATPTRGFAAGGMEQQVQEREKLHSPYGCNAEQLAEQRGYNGRGAGCEDEKNVDGRFPKNWALVCLWRC